MRIIVTGGAGFIGSNLIRYLLKNTDDCVLNIDKLVFPGSRATIAAFDTQPESRYRFLQQDIADMEEIRRIVSDFQPDAIMHLAAESHVDRSIDMPGQFIRSNVQGTYSLLSAARHYCQTPGNQNTFRFHHVSTDEVFGSLTADEPAFIETTPYRPNSPYSASKAAADHLVNAWHHTYGLPIVMSNCSNNYGPWQFPEKLIPLLITRAIRGESMPVYGDGSNIRDWLHVEDHVTALYTVLQHGRIGESYNVGGDNERSNIEVVEQMCSILDRHLPDSGNTPHKKLITFVEDRPGHDQRYAMNIDKISSTLQWSPQWQMETGLEATIAWYLDNQDWCRSVTEGAYDGERLGLG